MATYDNVKKFRFWCYKILPLTYDDSLSYYEVLCKVYAKLNECIDVVNEITGNEGLVEDVETLKTQVAAMQSSISQQLELINASLEDNTEDIEKLKPLIENNTEAIDELKKQQSALETLVNNLNDFVTNINVYIDGKINSVDLKYQNEVRRIYNTFNTLIWELQQDVNKIIDWINKFGGVDVYNYSACKRLDLDSNNTKLYIDLENAISAEEYCSLGLSAEEFKKFDMTALDYMRDSKKILHYYWVYMPVSGYKQSHNNALSELANYLFGTINEDEYVAKALTADEYAELSLTATGYLSWKPNET